MDRFDPYQMATCQNIAAYYKNGALSGEVFLTHLKTKASVPFKLVYHTAKLVYHATLRAGFFLYSSKEARRRFSVELWYDKRALQAWSRALFSLSEGLARVCVADLNAKTFKKLDIDKDTVASWGHDLFCLPDENITMGTLVSEGTLPSEGMLMKRGRADRFRQHYLSKCFDYEEAYRVAKVFLSHPAATQQLPPLFLSGAYTIDVTYKSGIPLEIQDQFWLVVARLRVEVCHQRAMGLGAPNSMPPKIEALIRRLEEELKQEKGSELASTNISSFCQWINPIRETLIYQKAFALPTLELLTRLPSLPKERSQEEVQKEQRLQEYVLQVGRNLKAHGIAPKRGGMKNLLNVMLEGFLSCAGVGPLVQGAWDKSAGPHGPIYIILDTRGMKLVGPQENHFPQTRHLAYLVPGKRDAQLAKDTLSIACQEGFITATERDEIFAKVLTYKELLDLKVRDSKEMIDPEKFKALMQKRVWQQRPSFFHKI